jgi:hypothetical protein
MSNAYCILWETGIRLLTHLQLNDQSSVPGSINNSLHLLIETSCSDYTLNIHFPEGKMTGT